MFLIISDIVCYEPQNNVIVKLVRRQSKHVQVAETSKMTDIRADKYLECVQDRTKVSFIPYECMYLVQHTKSLYYNVLLVVSAN